jgi:methyltransferase
LSYSQIIFLGILFLTIVFRLLELSYSKKNHSKRLEKKDTLYKSESYFFLFVVLHTSFLFSVPLEIFLLNREFYPYLGIIAFVVYIVCISMRISILYVLKENWNVKVIYHKTDKSSIITTGLYSYIRHPNYLVVILEILCISLFHSAFYSCLVFSLLNALILSVRIPFEEKHLFENPHYKSHFEDKYRFIPFIF